MTIKEYISELNSQFQTGIAREHAYRPALKDLFQELLPETIVTNEPARLECGAPDFIITRRDNQPIFFVEAKDIGDGDLDGNRQHREQFTRYKQSLDHVIFTDYLDFHLYANGEWIENVRIGEVQGDKIVMHSAAQEQFKAMIEHVANSPVQSITSARRLAEVMAAKAKLLSDVVNNVLNSSTEGDAYYQLQGQYRAFKDFLISDLSHEAFADMYAQTIAYGLFAARLHDETPENFSRMEAATLIPKTNPFLRQIFQSIAGLDIDDRIAWIVDDLVAAFAASDVRKIMSDYMKDYRHQDPMIHFYEDFLAAYDPSTRKAKGVWYTPQAVVSFIVRAVDEILQSEFGLQLGLADYSKVTRRVAVEQSSDKRTADGLKHIGQQFHRVQILDPATGTGTFLAETVRLIHDKFSSQQGMWQSYVEDHLIPRLNGFEILMASYAVAHLKLDMMLQQTGYTHRNDKRLRIYLTNSLEENTHEERNIWAQWLSAEAAQANRIKRDTPVMVMIGNPPYSVSSQNNGTWITQLVSEYKRNLNERNIQPLSDDYIKFIRLGHHYIERNGEGVLAFISNNSFIDGIIHRQMRLSLMKSFDKIYILDLHGNSRKKETAPDGTKDENVFDIMQGVSINIFIKTGKKTDSSLAEVYHRDLFGTRQYKYEQLDNLNWKDDIWTRLEPQTPSYFFVPKDTELQEEYERGFKINELFVNNVVGISTSKDSVVVCSTKEKAIELKYDLRDLTASEFREKYQTGNDSRDWSVERAKQDIIDNWDKAEATEYAYRPFDMKFLVYTGKTNGNVAWPRYRFMRHLLHPLNLGLLVTKSNRQLSTGYCFIVNRIVDRHILDSSADATYAFPLYNVGEADSIFEKDNNLVPNFNHNIFNKVADSLGFSPEPEQLFYYIYAVLHTPSYRQRYKEFLKIDFPRIPYPANRTEFEHLADTGKRLADLHLMRDSNTWAVETTFPESGNCKVEDIKRKENRVYINEKQYFGNVSETAWTFYIGGYQPAQKWLKDRKGHALSFIDIRHYEEIIHALDATATIMNTEL